MNMSEEMVVERMQQLANQWETAADQRFIFLSCYTMMTRNMLAAIKRDEFHDPVWVGRLLVRFADYYFIALEAYEQDPAQAPAVWQVAHNASRDPRILALQKLLLGVNAHIKYDLVLTLVDLLQEEWPCAAEDVRRQRYQDHCHVNEVIGATIDAVQDQVLEQAMPIMDVVDKLFGRMDEMIISRLITRWREEVWQDAVGMLAAGEAAEQEQIIRRVEKSAIRTAGLIHPGGSKISGA